MENLRLYKFVGIPIGAVLVSLAGLGGGRRGGAGELPEAYL